MAAKKMSVEQLEKLITANKDKSDHNVAEKLYEIELTEQLGDARLQMASAMLPGPLSREALSSIADISVFLSLPGTEVSTEAAPDAVTADRIFKKGLLYAGDLIPKLPNFYATRTITQFKGAPSAGQRTPQENAVYEPLHKVGVSSVTVLYRGGHEVIDRDFTKVQGSDDVKRILSTEGEFGPIISDVLTDSAQGTVKWSRWEKIAGVKAAVFEYTVPEKASHYTVDDPWSESKNNETPAYHGVIAINPADGSILRLTMIADMGPNGRVTKGNLLVDYGEVEIGGKKFILPVKSVALYLIRLEHSDSTNLPGNNNSSARDENWISLGPPQTRMNVMRFTEYHQFRAEVVISGAEDAPK